MNTTILRSKTKKMQLSCYAFNGLKLGLLHRLRSNYNIVIWNFEDPRASVERAGAAKTVADFSE